MALTKILLTGKNGQLGFELQRSLAILGDVIALDRADCDLANTDAVRELVQRVRPDIIVNPAAYTAVDQAETDSELTYAINTTAAQAFAEEAAKLGALLIHYSTDYVFDGCKEGWYVETDLPNPQSVYGKTKLAGEEAIRNSGCRHLIFRTSWVFGAHGGNFLKTMLRLMQTRDALSVINDQYGAPTSASLIADATAQIIAQYIFSQNRAEFAYGTYHLVAGGETSWHGYASLINDIAALQGYTLRITSKAIQAIPATAYPVSAPRPANSRLDTQKLQTTFGLRLPAWQDGVHQVMTLFKQGG
ncbi:dTDP-4-dehydrorhamnose reductase [Chitinibacter sp. S2-10]|uniref:dTDP-4-dehydrorhamnose reductase n=1 Tax=Chitinibacter sp. S2-10 TaxID=3373597 RepID=UPI003977A5E7